VTGSLRRALESRLAEGGRAFVPYVTGGLPGVDADLLRALAAAGADAIEVGIPFSDPVMDGPVIQRASHRALAEGATPARVLELVAAARLEVPVAVMTYLNPVLAMGTDRFAERAVSAGVAGAIVPDLPVEESAAWLAACARTGLEPVFLAAPNSGPERLDAVARASGGFVYCVAGFGVTGRRDRLPGSAAELVRALRSLTEAPLLVGVGVSTPDQAREACAFADGVVVGSALVAPLLDGDAERTVALTAAFRAAVPAREAPLRPPRI